MLGYLLACVTKIFLLEFRIDRKVSGHVYVCWGIVLACVTKIFLLEFRIDRKVSGHVYMCVGVSF